MTAASALTGAEIVPALQSSANVRTTTQDIADLAGSGGDKFTRLLYHFSYDPNTGANGTTNRFGGTSHTPALAGTIAVKAAVPSDADLIDTVHRQRSTTTNPFVTGRYSPVSVANEGFYGKVSGHALAGGFRMEMHLAVRTSFDTDGYFFAGLLPITTVPSLAGIEPDTFTNAIGICKKSTDSDLCWMWNDASGTANHTTTGLSWNTVLNKYLILVIEYVPGSNQYVMNLRIVDTPTDATPVTVTSNFPAADTELQPQIAVGCTSASAIFEWHKIIVTIPDFTD